jgi:hypothetical protein
MEEIDKVVKCKSGTEYRVKVDTEKADRKLFPFLNYHFPKCVRSTQSRVLLSKKQSLRLTMRSVVLPHDKVKLQEKVIRSDLPLMHKAKFSYYRRSDIPDFQYNRIVQDAEAGLCSAALVNECDGEWVHIYEADNPSDSLFIMSLVSILMKNYVRRRINIPKRLNNINDLHSYHYDFLNQQRQVESIYQLILTPYHFDRLSMCEHMDVILSQTGMLSAVIHHFINLPIINSRYQTYLCCPHAPPLGDITTCLYHVVYQYLFDRHFAGKYPEIVFTRCGNEV